MRPECKLNERKRRLRVFDLEVPPNSHFLWPRWGIVWFNSGLAFIYTCGGIILQLLKIMSAERWPNQGQCQMPSSHFMGISYALLYFWGPLNGQQLVFLVCDCCLLWVCDFVFTSICLFGPLVSLFSFILFKLLGISFIWLVHKLGPKTEGHTLTS